MNFLIISLVLLSLIGSVMWVMPTKRDKFLAKLRMEAKRLGFQIQLIKLTYPREKGHVDPRKISTIAYRLLRGKITQDEHHHWKSWRVVRCETNASEGLNQGWGWAVGERTLSESELSCLNSLLDDFSEDVLGVESTPIQTSVFWSERNESDMALIKQQLEGLISKKL